MRSRSIVALCAVVAIALAAGTTVSAVEPADPDLISEGRRLLEYLRSIEGKGIVVGSIGTGGGTGPLEEFRHMTGREPALRGGGPGGGVHGSDEFHSTSRARIDAHLFWGREKGGIVYMLYHWTWPLPDGGASYMKNRHDPPLDLEKMVTPGTEEYESFHEQLSHTADYLQELADARVPVLWAPFHEIDGGWFWWTDVETPENTGALYRQMFDYLVNKRQLHNLIWVYHAAHRCGPAVGRIIQKRGGWHIRENQTRPYSPEELEEEIAYRRRFYPGPDYVDIAGLSTYGNPLIGWGAGWEDARQRAYELMQGVAPGKPLAICETPQQIHPLMAQKQGVAWLWSMAWYPGAPADWLRYVLNHEHMITLDELPLFRDANVMPDVRIDWPLDSLRAEPGEIQISGVATDRNGNLETVSVHVLSEPWLNWSRRGDPGASSLRTPGVKEEFERGRRLGEARIGYGGRWTYTWRNVPAGYHQLAAFARDTEGAVGTSNVVRMAVGLNDLARSKPVSASSQDKWGGPPENAVDGDPWTSWWADRNERDEPQWLMVDLGAPKRVGAVSVLWWDPYAADYTVQVSDDAESWREVARLEGRPHTPLGDSDVHRFDPVPARYVRLHFTKPGVTWMTYAVHRFAVYAELP